MNTALIPISDRVIEKEAIQTVDARTLHRFLEVGRDFSNWIKDRISQYDFMPGRDYATYDGLSSPNSVSANSRPQRTVEYALTLDMAKELAMVEKTDKGKQARHYFIECERKAKTGAMSIHAALSDPGALRGLLLDYTEKVIALQGEVAELTPKAEFHDAVVEAVNCHTVQEVAKVLGTGRGRLFKLMREKRILMWNNLPYQDHLDAGRFRVVEKQFNDKGGASRMYQVTLVTGKGLAYLQKLIAPAQDVLL